MITLHEFCQHPAAESSGVFQSARSSCNVQWTHFQSADESGQDESQLTIHSELIYITPMVTNAQDASTHNTLGTRLYHTYSYQCTIWIISHFSQNLFISHLWLPMYTYSDLDMWRVSKHMHTQQHFFADVEIRYSRV